MDENGNITYKDAYGNPIDSITFNKYKENSSDNNEGTNSGNQNNLSDYPPIYMPPYYPNYVTPNYDQNNPDSNDSTQNTDDTANVTEIPSEEAIIIKEDNEQGENIAAGSGIDENGNDIDLAHINKGIAVFITELIIVLAGIASRIILNRKTKRR